MAVSGSEQVPAGLVRAVWLASLPEQRVPELPADLAAWDAAWVARDEDAPCGPGCACWDVPDGPCSTDWDRIAAELAEVPGVSGASGVSGTSAASVVSASALPVASVEAGWSVPGVSWDTEPVLGPAPLPAVSAVLSSLGELVGLLSELDPAVLPDGQVIVDAEALQAGVQRLRVLQLGWTGQVKARKLHALRGLRTMSGWCEVHAPDAVRADVTLAGRLADAPVLAAAVRDGRVGLSAAAQVGTAVSKVARYLDAPDGLIDGQPGEEVVTAVVDHTVGLVCEARGGEPDGGARWKALTEQTAAIHAAGGSMLARVQAAFTLLAEHLGTGSSLGWALGQQVDAVLPNLLEEQHARAQEHRGLSLAPRTDGSWRLEGTLTPEVGEQLFAALAAEARRDPGNPVDTLARQRAREQAVRDAGGDPFLDAPAPETLPGWEQQALRDLIGVPDASHPEQTAALTEALGEALGEVLGERRSAGTDQPADRSTEPGAGESEGEGASASEGMTAAEELALLVPRTPSRRLHDAFGRLLTRYLAAGLGGIQDKNPVQLTVTMTSPLVADQPGALPARSARTGRALARSLLGRWWGDAQVTTLLMSQTWQPLGVAHTGRTSTRRERLALGVQWTQRCAGTDCCPPTPDPLRRLIYHHVHMYSRHGRTSLAETIPICDHLHNDLHLGGKTIRLRDGRLLNENGFVPHDQ